MSDHAQEGQAPGPVIGSAELTQAIIEVDTIKSEQGDDTARAMNVDPDVLSRAAQVRYEIASASVQEYEREHGGPVEDKASVSAFWIDGFLIGLHIGHRLEERK